MVARELGVPEERVDILDLALASPSLRLEVLSRGVNLASLVPHLEELVEVRYLESLATQHWLKGDPLDLERLRRIESRIYEDAEDLKELLSKGLNEVLADKHLRKSFERTLQTLIEGMLDLLRHLSSGLNLGIAAYYRDYVELCVKAGLISRRVGDAIASLIPLRHALVHGYRNLNYEELWRRAEEAIRTAEELWGATVLAIKAYAEWRDGKRLTGHGELWRYKDVVADELGEWVRDSWNTGNSMHTCFYEGWCTFKDVESTMAKIERLVKEVELKISSHGRQGST